MHWYDCYVEKVPGVQGGEPVLAGTRTPVRSVVGYYHVYAGDLKEVGRALSHLQMYHIGAALDYYRDHQGEIDSLTQSNEDALQQFLSKS